MQKYILHTNRPVSACLWTEDRWWGDGPSPESNAVLYHYNLLCSVLPTAVNDNMFHPFRAYSEAAPLLLCTCSKSRCNHKTDWYHDASIILPLEDLEISELMLFYLSLSTTLMQTCLKARKWPSKNLEAPSISPAYYTDIHWNIYGNDKSKQLQLQYPMLVHIKISCHQTLR